MHVSRQSIKSLYRLSLVEQEGIGTAYEYYAKLARLSRFLRVVAKPKRILIAGLPERYGFSMDFFLLSEQLQAEIVAVDERPERVELAQSVLGQLVSKGILSGKQARFEIVRDLTDFKINRGAERFDIALSCEVVQRLDAGKDRYFSNLWQSAESLAVFVPNGQNKNHASHSGLRSLPLQELRKHCLLGRRDLHLYASGYLDMPPFPPGISRSAEKRDQAAKSRMEGFLMDILDAYCAIESFWPGSIKARFAHIAYVMARLQRGQ
jgi:hypothetical protein